MRAFVGKKDCYGMKTSSKKPTHWWVHARVFLVPILFWLIALVIGLVEQTAKGWSFFFVIMALYTAGFAILYAGWLCSAWLFARLKSRGN